MRALDPSHYYLDLAAAFCRGSLGLAHDVAVDDAITAADASGLRLSKFKRNAELPRVRRVLGLLRSFSPTSLLDVGSGRGTFLWPLLDAWPELQVTALDIDPIRFRDLDAVARGGVARLTAMQSDIQEIELGHDSWDGVTMLEVLEHMPSPAQAIQTAVRAARRFVLASVPSKPDDNPEHLHLITPDEMREMFEGAGARKVSFEHVPNHLVVVATV